MTEHDNVITCPNCDTAISFALNGACPACGARIISSEDLVAAQIPAEAVDSAQARIAAFQHALFVSTPRIWVTRAIVAINVVVFVLMVINGINPMRPETDAVIRWGANFGPRTMDGEWWRLGSSMFLHFGLIHIGFNMWVLWDIGQLVERLVGNVGFVILYFVSGLTGSIASLFWHPVVVSAGASGAVFGVFGALLGFLALRRDTVPPQILRRLRNVAGTFVVLNVILGFSMPGIDNAAHLGGLAGGFLCGMVLSRPLDLATVRRRWLHNFAATALSALLIPTAIALLPEAPVDLGLELQEYGKTELAIINKYESIQSAFHEVKLTQDQAADQIEKEVVVKWAELRMHIEGLTKRTKARRDFLTKLAAYLKLREESWQLQIEGLRNNDLGKLAEFRKKSTEANQAVDQLSQENN